VLLEQEVQVVRELQERQLAEQLLHVRLPLAEAVTNVAGGHSLIQ
jgi:hypothetical protein